MAIEYESADDRSHNIVSECKPADSLQSGFQALQDIRLVPEHDEANIRYSYKERGDVIIMMADIHVPYTIPALVISSV